MNVTPNELVASIRSILRETVLPELQSDLARARLRQVMLTLRDVDWDDAPLAVFRENEALRSLLPQPESDAPSEPSTSSLAQALQLNRQLRRDVATHCASGSGADWSEAHAHVAEVLANCAQGRRR